MKSLPEDLIVMRVKLELHKRKAVTFSEEAVIESIIYAVGNALDILSGKKSLLQGLQESDDNNGEDQSG